MQDKKDEKEFYEKMFSGVKDASRDGYCITYGYDDIYEHSIDKVPKGTILDVACGGGKHAVNLAKRGFKVYAIEMTTEGLRIARNAAQEAGVKIHFIQGDVEAMPFRDEAFDYSFCGLIFHHFPKMDRVIGEVTRVTKNSVFGIEPNACEPICNFMFNFLNPLAGIKTLTKNQRAIYPSEFTRLFKKYGFSDMKYKYMVIHHHKKGTIGKLLNIYNGILSFLPLKYQGNKFSYWVSRVLY